MPLWHIAIRIEGDAAAAAVADILDGLTGSVAAFETREGKRFLHIPEGAGYRNLVREMPAAGGVPQAGR